MTKKIDLWSHLTSARLIGLLALIIGVVAQMAGYSGMLVVLAGIILLVAPTKYCQRHLDMLVESLKGRTILLVALYDALFWLLFFGSGYFILWRFNIAGQVAQATTTLTPQAMINPAMTLQNLESVRMLAWTLVIGLLILLLFNFVTHTISRALMWSNIADKPLNKSFFKRFFAVNGAWWALWLIPFCILAFALAKNPQLLAFAFIGLLIIASYFTLIVHVLFVMGKKVGVCISHGIAFGIAKFYRFLVPFSFALIAYVIVFQLFRIATYYAPDRLLQPLSMLFVVLFLAWLRVYLYPVVKEFSD
ncbi:hypothetical protein HY489_00940 [Candidatus Woesearchaeota archaeon]|nr:hypothetical protein [Candidatus Woesearchaeota archaeon]